MHKTPLIAAAFLASVTAAQAEQWTILTQVCWRVQPVGDKRGQCAVGLKGTFRDEQECVRYNGGRLQRDTYGSRGEAIGYRCEIDLNSLVVR